jgi:sigma-B regulation protein RsbU (phosphoserine phosphatase)
MAGVDYFGDSRPASIPGTDFFGFIPIDPAILALSVGQVSPPGSDAPMLISAIQTLWRILITNLRDELPHAVEEVNRAICPVSSDRSSTSLFCATVDPKRRQLLYVNAGHEPALLFRRRTRHVHRLTNTGTVLGLTARAGFAQRRVTLNPGDVLAVFTEGISRAADAGGREWSDVGVFETLLENPDANPAEMVGRILKAVDLFTGRRLQGADRTVVITRFLGLAEEPIPELHATELACAAA